MTGSEIFGIKLLDDITAPSQKMANSLRSLTKDVKLMGDTFKSIKPDHISIGLKDARRLFKEAGQNVLLFKGALKDAGTSATDSKILISKMTGELTKMRRDALGMNGLFAKVFSIHPATMGRLQQAAGIVASVAKLGLGLGLAGAAAGGAAVKSFGSSIIENASSRQSDIAAMSYMLEGPDKSQKASEKEAGELYKWAQELAKQTPLDTPDVTRALTQFMTAQFTPRQSKILTQVMADQASKFQNDPHMGHNVISTFSRMQGRGLFTLEDLESARIAGFNEKKVLKEFRELPEMKHHFAGLKSDATEEEKATYTRRIISQQSGIHGQGIGALSGIQAMLNSLERDKPNIGTMAKKMGEESLPGAISNAKNAWGDLVKSVDAAEWPGMKALVGFLNRISKSLDSNTASGQNMLKIVREVTNDLFEGLDKGTQSDIDGVMRTLAEAGRGFVSWLKEGWGIFDKIVHGNLSLSDAVGTALTEVGVWIGRGLWKGAKAGVYDSVKGAPSGAGKLLLEGAVPWISDAGTAVAGAGATALWRGAKSLLSGGADVSKITTAADVRNRTDLDLSNWASDAGPKLHEAMSDVGALGARGMEAGAKGPEGFDNHSPSRRMMEVGRLGAQGMVKGAEGGLLGTSGGRGWTGDLVIHAGPGSAPDQWRAITPLIVRDVMALFERAAAEA